MYKLHMESADHGGVYHDSVGVGRAPVVAAHDIETAIKVLVGDQSVDIYRVEPIYEGPNEDIVGWMERGESVRLWRELVDLRDRVDVHPTAVMGSEWFSVVTRGENHRLLAFSVEWYMSTRHNVGHA